MDRHSQLWIAAPDGTTELELQSGALHISVKTATNEAEFFRGRRVLFTLSRDNRLEWIKDWLRYNRDIHGADAILFYDNKSALYCPEELLQAMSEVRGFDRICVVDWPFKYGPQGLDSARFWDSDFCQIGAWEHARWRFLQEARSALNSDVDELVVSSKGASIFEATERSRGGIIRFHGLWVHGFLDKTPIGTAESPVRYLAFDHYKRPPLKFKYRIFPLFRGDCPPKWAVVPSRCPFDAQWTAHGINDWDSARPVDRSFCYRHFKEINDNWKYDRSRREAFDPNGFVYDRALVSSLRRVSWTN
jgi:hypothetical protein